MAAAAFPELVPYLRCIDLGESPTVYGWGVNDGDGGLAAQLLRRFERSIHQGDVLGPLIHALARHPALQALAARHPRCTVLGLHDDGSVISPVEELAAVMRSAAEPGAKVDAELAPAKCAAWSPTPRAPPADLADQWRPAGLTYFGIPVGGAEFVNAEVDQMGAAHARVVRAVASLPPDAVQARLLLLRMCAAPLVTYALRCLPPVAATALAKGVDSKIRRALLHLLRAEDDFRGTRRAHVAGAALPVRMGGLGLGDRSVVTSAAHVVSWLATWRAVDLPAPALRELVRALSALPAVTAPGRPALGAAPPTTAGGGSRTPPAEWGGTSAWLSPAGNAAAATPPTLEPPRSAAPVGVAWPASLAAFASEGGLWGPLLPRLQVCLSACVAKATPAATGSPGRSPFESVAPPSPHLLLSLPPPLHTATIPAAGLLRSLGGVPDSWGAMLAAPTRLTQRQLAQAAHLAAARGMRASLSLAARARWAACCGHGSGLWLNRLPCCGRLGGAMKGAEMVVAVRLWLGISAVTHASARECRCGEIVDALGSHWLGGCPRSVPLRSFRHKEVLQRVATVLRVDPRWTGDVAEPPLPAGEQSPALRPDLRATSVASGAPLWGDVSVVAATAAVHVSRTAGSPRVPGAARVRETEKVGKYTPYLPAGDPPHTFTPLVWEASGRVGPATASFLALALGEENHREALTGLLTDVSLGLWRWNARIVLARVANSFRMGWAPLAAPPLVAHLSH